MAAPKDKHQQDLLIGILGASGHGKTSLIRQWVDEADKHDVPVRILDPKNQFPGRGEWPGIHEVDVWMRTVLNEGFTGIVILDDSDMYWHSQARSVWAEVLSSYRHLGITVIFNSRRPQEVPKLAFASVSKMALFNQREPYAKQYLAAQLSRPELIGEIPREKFRYLLVDVDTGDAKVHRTRKMPDGIGA